MYKRIGFLPAMPALLTALGTAGAGVGIGAYGLSYLKSTRQPTTLEQLALPLGVIATGIVFYYFMSKSSSPARHSRKEE